MPGSYKLVFELHYPDGRVEYELPSVSGAAAGLRIAGLLDTIGRTPYDVLREHLVKTLARSIWREHPEVKTVRAVFGSIRLPSVSEFEHGQRESYRVPVRLRFQPPERAVQTERSLNSMQAIERTTT